MFFAQRSCLIFPDPKNPKSPERFTIAPGERIRDEFLTDPKLVADLLQQGLIEQYDVAPPKPKDEASASTETDGYWNFNPAALQGMTLDQLNMLIQQHAAKVKVAKPPAMKDVEEALLFLTKDWLVANTPDKTV